MQRRKFLKLFGIGLSAAAIPTAVAAKTALTPPGEPKTAPQPPSRRPTATAPSTSTNPCGEILADGIYDILPVSRYFGSSINARTITVAKGHHAHIKNTTTGDVDCICGPQTRVLAHDEALLTYPRPTEFKRCVELAPVQTRQFQPQFDGSMPITPSMRQLIDQHARYQEHAMNGDSYSSEGMTKANAGEAWQLLADSAADRIEAEARVLGYTTQWPGLYPEFQPAKRHASEMQHWHQIAQNALPPIKNGEIQ